MVYKCGKMSSLEFSFSRYIFVCNTYIGGASEAILISYILIKFEANENKA